MKILVAPEIYDHVLNYVRSYAFCMRGKLVMLDQLRKWHVIVGVEYWPSVRRALSALDSKHKVKLCWKTDLFLSVPCIAKQTARWLLTRAYEAVLGVCWCLARA